MVDQGTFREQVLHWLSKQLVCGDEWNPQAPALGHQPYKPKRPIEHSQIENSKLSNGNRKLKFKDF